MQDRAAAGIVWVVVAAYNEARTIGTIIADLRRAGYCAVVVDDGSSDATADIAESAGGLVIHHPINLGQGAALQTGISFALTRGASVIVTFDADGQHRVADIRALVDALAQEQADYAIGSRHLGGAVNQPWSRGLLLRAATLFTRLSTGLFVTDTHNGLRAMTRRGAAQIRLRQNRMAHASEVLHQIGASGLKYVEVPVTVEYSAYSLAKGQSASDSLSILVDLFARSLVR